MNFRQTIGRNHSLKKLKALSVTALAGAIAISSFAVGAAGIPAANAAGTVQSTTTQTQTSVSSPYRIVVLGDSVSVGYEPGVKDWSDIYGYGDRLYEQALLHGPAELSNYAVVGLTSEGLTNLLQGAKDKKKLTHSQIQDFTKFPDDRIIGLADEIGAKTVALNSALANSNLVAMTIGGNDFLDYIRSLLDLDPKDAAVKLNAEIDGKLNNYTDQVKKAIQLIHELAPQATIKLTDQYLPMPVQYDAALYDQFIKVTDNLADRLDQLAKELDDEGIAVDVVPIRSLFAGKEMSLTHIFYDKDVHPNQQGYAAIAEQFSDAIWQSYTRIPAKDKLKNGQPVAPAIYINGQALTTPNQPMLRSSTTFLALTDVADATGAQVKWDNKTKTATFVKGANTVSITLGSKTMKVNGAAKALAVPAYAQQVGSVSKTYVPLAAIATGLQYQVVYRSHLNTAFINS